MRILISGVNGYIGSKLCTTLLEAGHSVAGLVRKTNEVSEALKIQLFEADVTKKIDLDPPDQVDLFIHLAAANDIDSADSFKALEVTTYGTKNCLDFCLTNRIKKFIYFSTFQVYGNLSGNFTETVLPKPVNDYGLTHLFAEEYVKLYQRKSGIEYIILRPTNIFGAPLLKSVDRWSLVPGCFCKEAVENGTITLFSSGLQVRDFIDLKDLCQFTTTLGGDFDRFKNATINVSSGHTYSILEIARLTAEIGENKLRKPISLNIKSNQPSSAEKFSIDRSLLGAYNFNFRGRSSLVMSIEETFDLLTGPR